MSKVKSPLLLTLFSLLIVYLVWAAVGFNEATQWEWNITGVSQSSILSIDVNNDSYLDLILAGCNAGAPGCTGVNFRIYTNNGSSFNENQSWQHNLTGFSRGAISAGDLNNDGYIDLIAVGCKNGGDTCGASSAMAKVYINNWTSFNENQSWQQNLTAIYWGSIDIGDINNDGRVDLALSGRDSSSFYSKIYLNNGTSLNENIAWGQNLASLYESTIAFGFINGDSFLDIIITGRDANINKYAKIYINNGTSLNEDITFEQELVPKSKTSITFMDFNNDGRLDVAIMGNSDALKIYENNGTTLRLNQTDAQSGGDLPSIFDGSLMFGDYDNDGDLDFVSNGREGYSKTYINNNTDFIEMSYGVLALQIGSQILLRDIDNNTVLDIIETGWYESGGVHSIKIYINNLTINNSLPYTPSTFDNHTLANGNVFLGWNNGSDNETISLGLYYNLRVGTTSGGNEIVSGIFGASSNPVAGYFGNMMQRRNISLAGSRFQVNTTYYWSVQTIDTGLAKSAWSAEQTFTLTSDFTPPVVTLNAPSGVTNQTLNIVVNATVYDDYNLTNVSLYGNWSGGWHVNLTNSSGINNTDYIFKANLTEGEWLFGIRACDATSNCRGVNGTFRIDVTYPVIALVSPANGTSQTSSNAVTFTYNVSDVAINNCTLYLNGVRNETDTSITISTSQTFAENVPNGAYNWSVRCADAANNLNTSGNYSLTISYTPSETPASTSGGGGGGGGGGGAVSATPKVSKITMLSAGLNQITFTDAEKASVGVEEILIESSARADYSKISVEKLSALPESIPTMPSAHTYTYLKIEKTILKDENVKNAKITFTVSKKWVSDNNYDYKKVVLQRYTADWEKLPTQFLKQDSESYYYQSTSQGFSVFAITAEKIEQGEKPIANITKQENITKEETPLPIEPPAEQEKPRQRLISYVFLAIIAMIIIAMLIITKLKRKRGVKK